MPDKAHQTESVNFCDILETTAPQRGTSCDVHTVVRVYPPLPPAVA